MAFASDFNLEELMSEASQIVEASKNGGAPLPDLSNLKATIRGLSNASVLDAEAERFRKWHERWDAGEVWIVADDVVDAFCKRVASGMTDYNSQLARTGLKSSGSPSGMFVANITGSANELCVGFCPMNDIAAIGRIAIRMCAAWTQLNETPGPDEPNDIKWLNKVQCREFVHFF